MADATDNDVSELLRKRLLVDAELSHYQQAAAVLFVDLVGSTRFYEQHGDVAGLVMVQKFVDALVPVVEKHQGEVVKTIGDTILARFQTAIQGVCCALNMQWSLLQHNSSRARDEQIHIRVALNYGIAFIKNRDVFGDVVNVCSRIESVAQADEILISPSVYDQICQHEEFAVRKRAEGVQLKGKAEKLDLYELVWRFGSPVQPLPPRPSDSQVTMAALPESHAAQEIAAAAQAPLPSSPDLQQGVASLPDSRAVQEIAAAAQAPTPRPSGAQAGAAPQPASHPVQKIAAAVQAPTPRPSSTQAGAAPQPKSHPVQEIAAAVQPSPGVAVPPRKPWPQMALFAGVVAVLVLALVVTFWRGTEEKSSTPAAAEADTASIAVLPFVDLSPEKNQEYFSDGLAEELLNDLSKIPGLRVTARTSSFQFRGKNEDLRVIGGKLNVGAILEGSVRKEGRRVRITAQLIKVSDGFHLWSETYDRELNDIFAVQEEIARAVAASLKLTLLEQKTTTASTQNKNVDALTAYLQGQHFAERRTKEGLEKAIDYYHQATELDSGYARAWAASAIARSAQARMGFVPLHAGYLKAREEAERALALDPNLADAHAAIGLINRTYEWDWAGAEERYRRALALEPGNAGCVQGAAWLAADLNHFDQALQLDRRALELDPLRASAHSTLAFHAWWAGRLDESSAAVQKGLKVNPDFPWLHIVLSRVYLARSRPEEALREAEREQSPAMHLQGLTLSYHAMGRKQESDQAMRSLVAGYGAGFAFQIAEVYAYRGDAERAFEWLERAYAQRDSGLSEIKGDPFLKNLERDPRYASFLKKMHLPT